MITVMPLAMVFVASLCLPTFHPAWKLYAQRPDDPSLSCYQHWNGTWSCALDSWREVDPDDSY
jgi:hypothetical protein